MSGMSNRVGRVVQPKQRLRDILIPGTTGGVYTLWTGTFILIFVVCMYFWSIYFNRALPVDLVPLMYVGVGLMTLHTGRTAVVGVANARVAGQAIEQAMPGEEITAQTPEASITVQKESETIDGIPVSRNPNKTTISPPFKSSIFNPDPKEVERVKG